MVKKISIILTVSVVLIAILSVLAVTVPGKDSGAKPEESTQKADQQTTAKADVTTAAGAEQDDIPENLNYNNRDIRFLVWSDHTMHEFNPDGATGDMIDDALFERNIAVEDRLGIKLKYTEQAGNYDHMQEYIKKAETDYRSGSGEYNIYASYSRTVAAMALNGLLTDISDAKYINFNKPWWPDALIDECTINDKLFYCSGDISTNLLWMMTGMFFNKDLIERYSLENPYELVANNEWTLDKFMEMCQGRYNDLDGSGQKDDGDVYGFAFYNLNLDSFVTSSDIMCIDKSQDGKLIVSDSMKSQRIYDLIDKLGEFVNSNDVYAKSATVARNVFFNQNALFTTDRVFIVAGKDNGDEDKIEFEYGIVPVPKYDAQQEKYYTSVGHPYTMYAISAGVDDICSEACGATVECLASESYKTVTPVVFETAMKIRYATDNDASKMYDILRGNIRFDLGRLYSAQVGDIYKVIRNLILNNSKSFASQYKGMENFIKRGIETIGSAFED